MSKYDLLKEFLSKGSKQTIAVHRADGSCS